jgi:hypothetical protein
MLKEEIRLINEIEDVCKSEMKNKYKVWLIEILIKKWSEKPSEKF